jgi:hypothetical protein
MTKTSDSSAIMYEYVYVLVCIKCVYVLLNCVLV